jgi:creatinine amidohydrolase
MMHLTPDLVLPLDQAGAGRERRFRIAGLREGWAWAPRRWTSISEDTGVGDPSAATAQMGGAFFRAVTERIAGFLAELAAADLDDLYGDDQGR